MASGSSTGDTMFRMARSGDGGAGSTSTLVGARALLVAPPAASSRTALSSPSTMPMTRDASLRMRLLPASGRRSRSFLRMVDW